MKTKRVRIAVAMDCDGKWASFGQSGISDESSASVAHGSLERVSGGDRGKVSFIEADVECDTEPETVKGEVVA